MSIGLLEAMSYGNNCLVSDIPENLQVIKNYGEHFKQANIQDLKLKLERMINNKNAQNKADIINYINKNFNWKTTVEETEKLYLEKM